MEIGEEYRYWRLIYRGTGKHQNLWLCQCRCLTIKELVGSALRHQKTVSCGCVSPQWSRKEKNPLFRDPDKPKQYRAEFNIWRGIKGRCLNPNDKHYERYGGRGITIYEEWIHSFLAFFHYVGPRPSPKHTIDRFPNPDGNYEPGNVRWATWKEQQRNKSSLRHLTLNDRSLTIPEWAEETGFSIHLIHGRKRMGWTDEEILTTPVMDRKTRVQGSNGRWIKSH
jgi:hypothetical protein